MFSEFPTDLQYELNQQREESSIKVRIANRNRDIETLYRSGSSPLEISYITGIHPDIVRERIARLEEDADERDCFLQTGEMPSRERGGYVAIFR
jgi:hypothetical protein